MKGIRPHLSWQKIESPQFINALLLVLKLIYCILGILMWCYPLMPYADQLLDVITLTLSATTFVVLLKYKARFKSGQAQTYRLIVFLMLGSGVASSLLAANSRVTFVATLYGFMELTILTTIIGKRSRQRLLKETILFSQIIVIVSSVIFIFSLLLFYRGYDMTYYCEEVTTTTLHLGRSDTGAMTGILGNANVFSSLCLIVTGLCLFLLYNKQAKLLNALFLLLSLFCTVLTSSRGGMYATILLFAALAMFSTASRRRNKKLLTLFVILLIPIALLVGYYLIRMLSTRTVSEMAGSTSVRFELWTAGLKAIMSDPLRLLFGAGVNFAPVIWKYASSGVSEGLFNNMHNIYLQTLVSFGVVGLCCFMMAIILHMRPYRLNHSKLPRNVAPLVALIFAQLILSLVESDIYLDKSFRASIFWVILGYQYALVRSSHYESRTSSIAVPAEVSFSKNNKIGRY